VDIGGYDGGLPGLDLFLFYFFWELMLVPMYFLIGIWGHEAGAGGVVLPLHAGRRPVAGCGHLLFLHVSTGSQLHTATAARRGAIVLTFGS
jgi:NADH:ubiquinone oxidoreductase subunit 4 (subunit M)